MLFLLVLRMLPYTEVVGTMSGCCGGSRRVSNLVREEVMRLLNQEQREAVEDKIIELGMVCLVVVMLGHLSPSYSLSLKEQYEIRSIIMKRAQQNLQDKKLHDQGLYISRPFFHERILMSLFYCVISVKQFCLNGEWFAILTLADYKDEEDVDYFIDVMKELMTWRTTNGAAPGKSQFRQLYSALIRFPHKQFWPFLVELHKLAISSKVS